MGVSCTKATCKHPMRALYRCKDYLPCGWLEVREGVFVRRLQNARPNFESSTRGVSGRACRLWKVVSCFDGYVRGVVVFLHAAVIDTTS